MAWSRAQKYGAEFLGTFGLLAGGAGVAVLGSTAATVGASNDLAGLYLFIAVAFGLVLIGMIYMFGDISGGHFNPAVTISLALSGKVPWRDVGPYVLAQVLGGIAGISVVLGIAYGGSAAQYSVAQSIALSSQCYSGGGAPSGCTYGIGAVLLVEVAITFLFVLVIQFVTRPESPAKNLAPMAIGFMLLLANLVALPIDRASINPARSFAPALVSFIAWPSVTWAISQSWLFWLAPILGGVLASFVERLFRRPMGRD